MNVVKRNKRLWIVDEGRPIYTPPDFLRRAITSRQQLERLAAELLTRPYIDAIMEFESGFTTRRA